jgi:hypothetical protein
LAGSLTQRIAAEKLQHARAHVRMGIVIVHNSPSVARTTNASAFVNSRYHQTTTENGPSIGACSVTDTILSTPISLMNASACRRILSRFRSRRSLAFVHQIG